MVGVEGSASRLVMVCGPSRGGKSRWAEHLAHQDGRPVLYLATGSPGDGGSDLAWQRRVEAHRLRRPGAWTCQETGPDLQGALDARLHSEHPQADHLLLVDSLGSWLAWHLDDSDSHWRQRCDRLLTTLLQPGPPVVLVVEETGWGVVPPTAIGGLFRDRLGALQQRLMRHAGVAWLVVGGRALDLLQISQPVPEP
ncbi:MAG: bifunctional adenosylcobinamide kinase/adenosylcobinamide-phosphate guanylyltransferase [Synechococcaceae bacterium WBB_3_034]|nr:bifunctional adenosylcobinamide kinase/adenosylcobinamide-phosphate guanylyltransferase [Synechococcaceae bacterium WBB_3_034]